MQIPINIGGEQFIVPTDKIDLLRQWLKVHAVQIGQREVVKEITSDRPQDNRQLLVENEYRTC